MKTLLTFSLSVLLLALGSPFLLRAQTQKTAKTDAGMVVVEAVATDLVHPWGLAFLPDGRMLVTERPGRLRIVTAEGERSEPVAGTPEVFAEGQGGLLDVALDPEFAENQYVYLTFAEPGADNTVSTAVGRGRWVDDRIEDFTVLFSQQPKISGPNHFGGRVEFGPDGMLYLTTGERFKFDPAQDLSDHLGTVIRLHRDGSVPKDNPFVGQDDARPEIWSYGHRNIEAAAFDPRSGKFWVVEMGPKGGDEFNQPAAGKNYGWPIVSWGKHYDGESIPNPPTRPEFSDAAIHWTPVISPSGMIFYTGDQFPDWKNHALIGGLTAKGVVVVRVDGEKAKEVDRIPLGARTRDVVQGPDGAIYVLTDQDNGDILRLTRPENSGRR